MRRVLFDRRGHPGLYLTGAGVLYTLDNEPLGRIEGEAVVSYSGSVIAWFVADFLWDEGGRVVAFVKGAKPPGEGFDLPPTEPLRAKLKPKPAPFHPLLRPANRPRLTWQWSQRSLEGLGKGMQG